MIRRYQAFALFLGAALAFAGAQAREMPSVDLENLAATPEQVAPSTVAVDLESLRSNAEAVVESLQSNTDGEIYSGAVKGANPDDLAVAVALVDGRSFGVGKAETRFPLMSISKPFTYALAAEQRGIDFMIRPVGDHRTRGRRRLGCGRGQGRRRLSARHQRRRHQRPGSGGERRGGSPGATPGRDPRGDRSAIRGRGTAQ